jgi:predicted metal-dependent HD superfamily phosphohydrolase
MFDRIRNDSYIIDIYNKIESPENNDRFWTFHGLRHVNNVIETVENTLIQLGYDDEYIENAKIAALLHDLGMLEGKEDHDIRSYEKTKKYLEDTHINLKYKEEVLDAIRSHRDIVQSDNIMALVLVFADKIDIKKTRLAPKGYDIVGLRQYQYIDDININKEDNNFKVQFIVDSNCNKQELEDYYFTPKVFGAINIFANNFNYNLKILWNNEEWILNKAHKKSLTIS